MSSNEVVIKNRFLGFLLWQCVQSTIIYIIFKTIFLSPFLTSGGNPFIPSLSGILAFLTFHVSLLLFSAAVFTVSSPQPNRAASPFELALGLVRLLFVSGGESTNDFRRRVEVSLRFFLFAAASALSGFLAVGSLCWAKSGDTSDGVLERMGSLGLRGFALGLIYGLHFVFRKRWILEFPIIQRPLFFSFKMGLPSAIRRALRLSCVAYLLSAMLLVFLPQNKIQHTIRKFITEQISFYIGSFAVFLCWELSHHLHQVLHTKRFIFAPPKGSAAAETNPSEPLLAALEESTPRSLLQYLAYLDLSMVCESNVDTWRRAAFFEETGETYKRVVALCLRPLEGLASELGEGLGSYSADTTYELSHQLRSPTDLHSNSKFNELFDNFQVQVWYAGTAIFKTLGTDRNSLRWDPHVQACIKTFQTLGRDKDIILHGSLTSSLCAWCARTVASLTVCSRKEDRFGVAQLSGSNAYVISTLISSLLAVETFMGKKTNLQNPNQLMGPAGIKWATMNTGRREVTTDIVNKRRGRPLYSKAYAMADILRTSIYHIVTAFHDEMLSGGKSGLLEKDWVITSKPPYGTCELLLQKLRLFLDFRAN